MSIEQQNIQDILTFEKALIDLCENDIVFIMNIYDNEPSKIQNFIGLAEFLNKYHVIFQVCFFNATYISTSIQFYSNTNNFICCRNYLSNETPIRTQFSDWQREYAFYTKEKHSKLTSSNNEYIFPYLLKNILFLKQQIGCLKKEYMQFYKYLKNKEHTWKNLSSVTKHEHANLYYHFARCLSSVRELKCELNI